MGSAHMFFKPAWATASFIRQASFNPLHTANRHEFHTRDDPSFSARSLRQDRKSTRLNSSHVAISYAVFCLKKKTSHKRYITNQNHVPALASIQVRNIYASDYN